MIKKAAVAAGVFALSVLSAGTMVFAQTTTPDTNQTNTTVSPTTNVSVTPSPTRTVPGGAPATGHSLH